MSWNQNIHVHDNEDETLMTQRKVRDSSHVIQRAHSDSLMSGRKDRHFADDFFKYIFCLNFEYEFIEKYFLSSNEQ